MDLTPKDIDRLAAEAVEELADERNRFRATIREVRNARGEMVVSLDGEVPPIVEQRVGRLLVIKPNNSDRPIAIEPGDPLNPIFLGHGFVRARQGLVEVAQQVHEGQLSQAEGERAIQQWLLAGTGIEMPE